MRGSKNRLVWGSGGALVAALILGLFAFGAPAGPGGCGGPDQDEQLEDDLAATCSAHQPMRIHFYNVEQGLAAMVELPDGRHILIDTGADAKAPGCGDAACNVAHDHLIAKLTEDLAGKPIDLLWVTHQHMDHIGGAADLMAKFHVVNFVDNGRDPAVPEILAAHAAANRSGTHITLVDPSHRKIPVTSSKALRIRPIVPASWLNACNSDENDCSIGLRIDYCDSSALFMGDAEVKEEAQLDPLGPATLLQLGHHGSDTSSGADFLAKVAPKIAVVSAGKPGFGMNRTYCHPRSSTVSRVTDLLGGPGSRTLLSFDGTVSCMQGSTSNWLQVKTSDHLFATERDGDLTFVTTGDGQFASQ